MSDHVNDFDFTKKLPVNYSPLAKKLLANKSKKESTVKIDHLAFSFALPELRHCCKAGSISFPQKITTGYKKSFFDNKNIPIVKTYKPSNIFPSPPKIENSEGKTIEDIERHSLEIQKKLTEFYIKTLEVFTRHVLGFNLTVPRGKGFHGYKDSMTLRTDNGVEVGFVGLGGRLSYYL